MKREFDDAAEVAQSQLTESASQITCGDAGIESDGSVLEPPINRPLEADRARPVVRLNGFVVYTRNKRLKSAASNGVNSNNNNNNISVGGIKNIESKGPYETKVTSANGSETSTNCAKTSANGSETSPSGHASENGKIVNKESSVGGSAVELLESNDDVMNKSCSGIVNVRVSECNLVIKENGVVVEDKSEMVEVEVKQMPLAIETKIKSNNEQRRLTRSALKSELEMMDIENEEMEGFRDAVVMTAEDEGNGTESPTKKLEMKMSKKIEIKGRPTTVLELFETGLLEDYPVFYNGGKKGILLRGTVKDIGILCFCNFCQGAKVIPPSQFEIHAIKTYKRASQYICLENGKSLLDIVKECSKCSLKALQETIQSFIGPLPVKESIVCRNCKESFMATSSAMIEQVCDACVVHIRRETNAIRSWRETNPIHATYVKASVASLWASESVAGPESSGSADAHTTPKKSRRGRKKKMPSTLPSDKKSPGSSLSLSSKMKSQLRSTERLPESDIDPNTNGSVPVHKVVKSDSFRKISNRSSKSASTPNSLRYASTHVSASSKVQWKITKKDQRMHKLVFEEGGLPDGTEVAYYSRGKKLLEGYKKRGAIFCLCCSSEVSPSTFEAHAGWASRRKPYGYIYTSNGVSLHEFAISLLKGRKYSAKDSDDLCIICADGGKLVLCDGCPRAFHRECASLSSIPRGKWYCKYCENMFQREKHVEHNANALAAGRVSGIDPIEQITKRCIRIVKNPEEAEVIACVICRGYDFSKSGFGPRTVILCDQCEKEYHVGCLKKSKMADLKELPKGKWFCSMECKRIYSALQNLLNSGPEKLSESCLDVLKKKHRNNIFATHTDLDVRWRLLSGKVSSRETRLLLSEAVAIFHDCFDPIVDSATGRDFIPSMVYGRNIRGQDFSGMYCAILTVNSSVVSAGIVRIFGQDMAELPLVATRICNQGNGFFQLLFSCIEKLLAFLNVRNCVLPAADEAESIWTKKFGFKKIPQEQLIVYKKTCWQMISFKGTSMLEKPVPKCRIIRQEDADSDLPAQ